MNMKFVPVTKENGMENVCSDKVTVSGDNYTNYEFPPTEILTPDSDVNTEEGIAESKKTATRLLDALEALKLNSSLCGFERGPRFTRYEIVPAEGVKVSSIVKGAEHISLSLASGGVRVEAPIPGKNAIGFEIPNEKAEIVRLRGLLESEEFKNASSKTTVCIGKDVAGHSILADVAKMPHALIAGAVGMGKSVCINSLIVSILYKARPDEVKFILIDPKKIEFNAYNGIPHLLTPVISEPKQAVGALRWAVDEVDRRYGLMEAMRVRNVDAYNEKVAGDPSLGAMLPKIIIVIDELSDLILQAHDSVENLIMSIAQKARAAGIHLIISTQRPSVEVITSVIKANIPTRISCKVSSNVESKAVLEQRGAEELLGKGDIFYLSAAKPTPVRVQSAFVSESEVEEIVKFVKERCGNENYDGEILEKIIKNAEKINPSAIKSYEEDDDGEPSEISYYFEDEQFVAAVNLAFKNGKVSSSLLQRSLSIGYGKAAKYVDAMENFGIIEEASGSKAQKVLITKEDWDLKTALIKSLYSDSSSIDAQDSDSADDEKPKIAWEPVNEPDYSDYLLPPTELLGDADSESNENDVGEIESNAEIIKKTFDTFKIKAEIKGIVIGPRVIRYEIVPAVGVKVSSILSLKDDLALNLAKEGVRIEAPIPGKSAIGIEIPKDKLQMVHLRGLIESEEFRNAKSKTAVCVGKDIEGSAVLADIAKLPHVLIAGATGMGKSVFINSMIVSLLCKSRPDEVKFIMIDLKRVQFTPFNGLAHLLVPVITDPRTAAGALSFAIDEMENRYERIERAEVRNIDAYNEKVAENPTLGKPMPKIVIFIDELYDLMLQMRDPIENLIMCIAQKARAAGIHLVIGSQRPSVDVLSGVIKANVPSRISFKVTSPADSRTILDQKGAEELVGKGDMLYFPMGKIKPVRIQGAFVSDEAVERVIDFLKNQVPSAAYDDGVMNKIAQHAAKFDTKEATKQDEAHDSEGGVLDDKKFLDAVNIAINIGKVSTSLLQRKLSIGYGKAAKYIDIMEEMGFISSADGQKARLTLITKEEWDKKLARICEDEEKEEKKDIIAVLLADGFEEIEALTPIDVLRRAGLEVKTVAVSNKIALGSHGIPVICDMMSSELESDRVTAVILPGGMPGSLNLDASLASDRLIGAVNKKGGIIAAICAAPLVLGRRDLLQGKRATCYPGFEKELKGATYTGECVTVDGNIVTSRGMGTALEFALTLVELIKGKDEAVKISESICEKHVYGSEN